MDQVRRKVVFVESAAAMGGVQFSTLYLARALDRTRWKPIVVCPAEGDLPRACRDAGIETHIIDHSRLWSTSVRLGNTLRLPNPFAWVWDALVMARAARGLQHFLKEVSPELIITKGLSSHFIGGMAARRLQIPCVWQLQDLISERTLGLYRRIFGIAASRLPSRIISDGAAIQDQLPSLVASRVSVIHNGVDTTLFRPGLNGLDVRREFGIADDELVIGHAGRITPWKGQHYLVEAFKQIADRHPNVTLLFAGAPVFDHDGYQRRLETMTAEAHLQNRIKFAGYRHDLQNVLAAMDVFAFTSIEKDTSPLALLSAMSSGLPIVAFDIQGVRELIDTNELITVPVGASDDLATALQQVIMDVEARERLGQSVRRLAEERFSLERFVARIEEVLLQLDSGSINSDAEKFEESRRTLTSATSA